MSFQHPSLQNKITIKIQPNTLYFSTRLWGIDATNSSFYSEPGTEVYCFSLNFKISKLVYCTKGYSMD